MNYQQRSFRRKVIYLLVMAGLLIPLSMLGMPPVRGSKDEESRRLPKAPDSFAEAIGAWPVLANLRFNHRLGQSNLGEIDPGSETMKLATLGLRGVAANLLWEKAREYKKREDWSNLKATLDQIKLLQPNFVSVWRFQGWNLSFNVSAEWDDYRQRYFWVCTGIEYLHDGQRYNDRNTRLFWDEGWFTSYKIGRADEYLQFRRLFRDPDTPANAKIPPRPHITRDNWLWGRESFVEAIDLVENRGARREGAAAEVFFSEPAKCQMRYAGAGEEEGLFREFREDSRGESAQQQWSKSLHDPKHGWLAFAERPFATRREGVTVKLNDWEKFDEESRRLTEELDALGGKDEQGRTIRQRLRDVERQKLTDDERAVLDKPKHERSRQQRNQAADLEDRLRVSNEQVLARIPAEKREKAASLIAEIKEAENMKSDIAASRGIVNFLYWRKRAEAESSDDGVKARQLLFEARRQYKIDKRKAKEPYEMAFQQWRVVLDKDDYTDRYGNKILVDDAEVGDDLIEEIRRYVRALELYPDYEYRQDGDRIWIAKLEDTDGDGKHDKETELPFVLADVIVSRQPSPPIGK